MSRQNFYKERKSRRKKELDVELIINLAKEERKRHARMGGRKLLVNIRNGLIANKIGIGRDRFFVLLKDSDLLIKRRKRSTPKTTNSNHNFRKYANLIKDKNIEEPNEVWQSDITYINASEGYVYLSLITDSFSRKIIGYNAGDTLEMEGCLKSLKRAKSTLKGKKGVIHHSDRGSQYCCRDYTDYLKKSGFLISMTEENHCYENAKAERVNGILKQEYGLGRVFKTKKEAVKAVNEAINLYNNFRPHASLKYETPEAVHSKYAA